jgi:hypothetical protein
MDDSLVILESDRTADRMRKILFDRVEGVLLWKRLPWGRMLLVTLLIAGPSIAVFWAPGDEALVIGGIGLSLAMLLLARYLWYGKSTLRLVRAGEVKDFTVIMRPGKLRKKVAAICQGVEETQARERAAQGDGVAVAAEPPQNPFSALEPHPDEQDQSLPPTVDSHSALSPVHSEQA